MRSIVLTACFYRELEDYGAHKNGVEGRGRRKEEGGEVGRYGLQDTLLLAIFTLIGLFAIVVSCIQIELEVRAPVHTLGECEWAVRTKNSVSTA